MTRRHALLCAALLLARTAVAQPARAVTDAEYTRAMHQLGAYTAPLVDHAVRSAHWSDATHFWYLESAGGVQTLMTGDAALGTIAPAFATAGLVTSLHTAGYAETDPTKLAFEDFAPQSGNNTAIVTVGGSRFECALQAPYTCKKLPDRQAGGIGGYLSGPAPAAAVLSPDGKRAVFLREWNLWARDVSTGAEKPLTTDGVKDFGYATDNAGWKHSDQAIVIWSPDSKMVATFQQDQRNVADYTTATTNVGHAKLDTWKYPFVGDRDIIHLERVIVNVDSGTVTRLSMPPDLHRSSLCDDVICGEGPQDMQWAKDGKTLAFVSTSRDHKVETVRMADVATGAVREVFTETVPTWFDSGYGDEINWRYLSARNEILWWSQRSEWGHYYLYDAGTGKLKRQVTHGEWNVDHLVSLDETTGDMLLAGVGREKGEDPYYRSMYAVNLKGGEPKLLTPERQDHVAIPSSDGRYFVDIYSTPQEPQTAVLRKSDGTVVKALAKGDVTRLKSTGWQAPESIAVPCSDGKTLCYGLLFKPAGLDPAKKYPVIDYIYPGPFTGTLLGRQFAPSDIDSNALAHLGFAVVEIDAMGTPRRSKQFQDFYFHDMGRQAIPDQVSGIQDLARKYPWMDLGRVGIWGHSGGGNATATSMFLYPDFYKVGIAESGNQDNRNYEDDYYEKYLGLLERHKDGTTNYDVQANQLIAKNLKGKLMLAHGLLDDNVPVSQTFLIVDALEKANKDYDLLLFPRAHHGYGDMSYYMMRRRWDYFVTNLMGATPPHEFKLEPPKR